MSDNGGLNTNPEEILEQTQTLRTMILDQLGAQVADSEYKDMDLLDMLRKFAADADGTAIKQLRLRVDEKANENEDALVKAMIQQMYKENGMVPAGSDGATVNDPTLAIDETSLPDVSMVDGEMDTGLTQKSIDDYIE